MTNFIASFKKGMQGFGQTITTLVNSILLSAVYLVGVGITSIIAKVFRKKFFELKLKKQESYWVTIKQKENKENYYRQF
jgi:hypothetical protein